MDIIGYIINDLINGNADLSFKDSVLQSATSYDSEIWGSVIGLMKDSVFPIGAAILTIFMLMEIVGIIQRMDNAGQGMMGINIPATIIIRWVIITFLYCHLGVLLEGINGVMETVATNITYGKVTTFNFSSDDVVTAISSMDTISQIVCYIIMMNIWFIFAALKIILDAFVVYRMFSIYIMTVFAPIPLATLPSQEHKHTAFNYLKSYAAACMSGAVILAAFQIYNLLNTSVLKDTFEKALEMGVDAAGNPMPLTAGAFCGVMLKMLIFYGILVSAVLSSGKISKSLLNAA